MAQKPKSLKDLKNATPQAAAAQQSSTKQRSAKDIHSAIGDAKGNQVRGLVLGLFAVVSLSLVAVVFYVYSQAMTVRIGPEEAISSGYVTLESGLGRLSDEGQIYVLGSSYKIGVHADGFKSEYIDITSETAKSFLDVTLIPKPASVTFATEPSQDGTKWILDNKLVSTRAGFQAELEPGEHEIIVDHRHFEPVVRTLTLERAKPVEFTFPLSKIQGQINIQSVPARASVTIDGGAPTVLPHAGSLEGGMHVIQVQATGYMPVSDQIEITNTQRLIQRSYRLRAMQSSVIVTAQPSSAQITLDGRAINNSAVVVINANQSYSIAVYQKGYNPERRTISVSPGQTQKLSIPLEMAVGTVSFRSRPRGADVLINGQNRGKSPVEIDLQALPTQIEFRRAGYRATVTTTMPVANEITTVDVKLYTELEARLRELPLEMIDNSGIALTRFRPDQKTFYIGARRGEIGQRANEILRQVQLTKHFYASKYEITVGQFRKFRPGFGGSQAAMMPVTGVTWAEAAQFCNWLSEQEGLTAFYQISDGQVFGYDKYADGYRLPSEAEWEWLARKAKRRELTQYAWGIKKVITSSSGNLADESAKGTVPAYVPGYTDKYAGVAPVGSFPEEVSGLYDMSGNVREWVNDQYSLSVPAKGTIAVNSFGPPDGEGNVAKGSGFRSASLTDLGAASRHQEYSAGDDIGFRVVRYVYGAEDK
jgi:formylglycine-generating enzyme required for sulfatase activity